MPAARDSQSPLGFATRALYTDDEETIFTVCRPVLLNGIPDLLGRPDLADRALAVHLPAIPEGQRRTEAELLDAFACMQGRVLGALLDGVARGLANERSVRLPWSPRMVDAATWVVAAEPALRLPAGAFLDALAHARDDAVAQGLEADPLGPFVLRFVEGLEGEAWEGPATPLLDHMNRIAPDELRRAKSWPKNAKALTEALRRLAPLLRRVGMEVITGLRTGKGRRVVLRRRAGDAGDEEADRRLEPRHAVRADTAEVDGRGDAGDARTPPPHVEEADGWAWEGPFEDLHRGDAA